MNNTSCREEILGHNPGLANSPTLEPLDCTHLRPTDSRRFIKSPSKKRTNNSDLTLKKLMELHKSLPKENCISSINKNSIVKSVSCPVDTKVDQWLNAGKDSPPSVKIESFLNRISPEKPMDLVTHELLQKSGLHNSTLSGPCHPNPHSNKDHSASSGGDSSQPCSSSLSNENSSSSEAALHQREFSPRCSSVKGKNCSRFPVNEESKFNFGEIPPNEQSFIDCEIFSHLAEDIEFASSISQERFRSRKTNLPPPGNFSQISCVRSDNFSCPLNLTEMQKKPANVTPVVNEVCNTFVSNSPNYNSGSSNSFESSSDSQPLEVLNASLDKFPQEKHSVIEPPSLSTIEMNKAKETRIPNGFHIVSNTRGTNPLKETSLRLDRPYRVFVWGGLPLPTVDIVVNKAVMAKSLNQSVLRNASSVSLATRLQAYMWPVISRGKNVIAVGARSSGKTSGFILPLASLLLDTWSCIEQKASVRSGSVAVIVCKGWRAAQRVGNELSELLSPHGIRVVSAWRGLGLDCFTELQKELYQGCDVLVSTLPFVLWCLTGVSEESKEPRLHFDLSFCFHLVLDDADVLLDTRAQDVKAFLREWGVTRSKRATTHFCQQLVVTASSWTNYISDLAEFLSPLMEPTILISSHLEAAKAAGVRCVVNVTQCFGTDPQPHVLGDVMNLVKDEADEKKVLVFVEHYSDARQLQKFLESRAVYSRLAHGRLLNWQLREEIKTWRSSNGGKILIVSNSVVPLLLQQDIRDAFVVVHTCFPDAKADFVQRFSFLLDNYGEPFKSRRTAAWDPPVTFVMLDDSLSRLPPYLLECLEYLDAEVPPEVKHKFTKRDKRDVPLCHYLKAYGSCPSVNLCIWRHDIVDEDLRVQLPDSGIVTVKIVKVLNASRYLVRLNQYRKKLNDVPVDLSKNYFTLFMKLQSFCSGERLLKKFVKPAHVGDLCLVNNDSAWARAKVLSHRQSHESQVLLFLIDEGSEITLNVSELYEMPSEFSALPQLVLEVYLCKVRPVDDDLDWTQNANMFVENIFSQAKDDTQFTGTIAMSLSHTLWLSPFVEIAKVGDSLIKKESIRSQLIAREYGTDNAEHLQVLERHLKVVKAQSKCPDTSWLDHWTPNRVKVSTN